MWNELGISGGTAIVILIALYFVIKWAVKNGIKEAYSAITGKKTEEELLSDLWISEVRHHHKLLLQVPVEQNRCAMACQGCGAAFLFSIIK